jgi:hypothetical protein
MKVGILVPCTSKGRSWNAMRETYLFQYTLRTFLATRCPKHDYIFYIGYDADDPIFSKKEEQEYLFIFKTMIKIQFIELNDPPGHLTKMWNKLFRIAYDEGCDYFFQCGDDIFFRTTGWVNDSIRILKQHTDIGITGPDNNNGRILTQSFVSRKHMEIFGEYFPESIVNWGCDDWYNWVYEGYIYKLKRHTCTNEGGQPRYVINHDEHFDDDRTKSLQILRDHVMKIAVQDRKKINAYISSYLSSYLKSS